MRKQLLMSLTTLSLLVTLSAASVCAQSGVRLNVNIPFEFSVRDQTFPAGEYTVRYIAQGVLAIQSADRHASQIFTVSTRPGTRRDESSIVFNQYGNRYFLSSIWTAGNDYGYELRKFDAERQLIRARSAVAEGASESQIVCIVARWY